MTSDLLRRLADLISTGEPFTADDLTDDGAFTVDASHAANGRQSAIGAVFRSAARDGHIVKTGRVVRSRSPHRKGGMIQEWCATNRGHAWAERFLTLVPR